MMEEQLILVDNSDNPIGTLGKTETHKKGLLHRAFSVFIFNDKNELLLQQRALNKYHSAGCWTNTCCSHPRQFETTIEAAERRLFEEMGMKCKLEKKFDFIYKATFENGLIEHEYDHVYFGKTNLLPIINTDEVMDWKYLTLEDIEQDLNQYPEKYTVWFKICLIEILTRFNPQQSILTLETTH